MMTQVHVEPPQIPLIKVEYDGRSDKDLKKLKLWRDPKSSMSGLYELNMSLFDNGDPEEFLLFVRNFNMTIAASGAVEVNGKVQRLCKIVRREALLQFYLFSSYVEIMNPLTV